MNLLDDDTVSLDLVPSVGGRVLIAESYPSCAESLALLLDRFCFTSEIVRDGPSVLPAVRSFKPHIVVLDLVLPGLSGRKVARQLLALPHDEQPGIVVVTGYSMPNDRKELLTDGVSAFFLKPADPAALLEALWRITARSA